MNKLYEVNDYDSSVMQISFIPQSASMVMAVQGQNAQLVNQGQTASEPRLNWKADFI